MVDPNLILKEYINKSSAKCKFRTEVKVQNNLRGLVAYLTAPNIKNKQKCLLFYLLKFSSCLSVATQGFDQAKSVEQYNV